MKANLAAYSSWRITRRYGRFASSGTIPQEKICLEMVPEAYRGSVLDIGIGGGRTVPALSTMFRSYVGLDYSKTMVAEARRRFPDMDFRVMDAREMSFPSPFDCVMFSFNGIDYVNFDDRQKIFRRVSQLLSPGGYFIYSTHNLHFPRTQIWFNHIWVKELFTPLNKLWKKIWFLPNRLINFFQQSIDEQNAIAYVNDPGEWFAFITAYIDIAKELENLKRHGFSVIAVIGDKKATPRYDSNDNWVYIVARKELSVSEK